MLKNPCIANVKKFKCNLFLVLKTANTQLSRCHLCHALIIQQLVKHQRLFLNIYFKKK